MRFVHLFMKKGHFTRIWWYKGLVSLHSLSAERWKCFAPIYKLLLSHNKIASFFWLIFRFKIRKAVVKGHHRLTHVKRAVLKKLGRKCIRSEWDTEAYADKKKHNDLWRLSPFYPGDLNAAYFNETPKMNGCLLGYTIQIYVSHQCCVTFLLPNPPT